MGSSAFITRADGEVEQHLQYLPSDYYRNGETFIDQRMDHWSSRYTFSAKEKDLATSYNYFGARYYDSEVSVWLSVDPLADDFPSWTPYHYCHANPLNMIDPDGNSADWVERDGKAVWDPDVHGESDIDPNSGDSYIGKTAYGTNDEGQLIYGDQYGNTHRVSGVPLEGVTIEHKQTEHEKTMSNPIVQAVHQSQQKVLDHTLAYPFDFIGGVYDFVSTYVEMRRANWTNSDRYFHSKANFKASKRGPGGAKAAKHLSNLREIIDQRVKGDSRADAERDQEANLYGRNMGWKYRYERNVVPRSVLTKYRPHNLPEKY